MAAPAVTGVVALMRERHPDWTPAQIRAALIGSAVPAYADSNATVEASPLRTGGGFVDAPGAVAPGVLSDPPLLGFGLLLPGASVTIPVSVSDAGDGAARGRSRSTATAARRPARSATAPAELTVPPGGAVLLPVTLTVAAGAPEGDAAGYVLLTQGTRTRRIPYWAHVERPRLAAATARLLRHPGIVRGSTRGQPDRVERYRYPAYTGALGLPVRWRGGEALYRFHLAERAINVGVTVEPLAGGGLRPFLMRGLDENRLAGESGLPIDVGPSLTDDPVPSAGLYWAPPGDYAVAVDSARRRGGASGCASGSTTSRRRRSGACASPATEDAAYPRDRRGLGRRSALPRVRARAAGLLRDRPAARLGRAQGHRIDLRRTAAAGRYALAVRAGDYAESRDALAISLSPQHVRTRVIGLAWMRAAPSASPPRRARPVRGPAAGRRRLRRLRCRHGRCDPVHAWRPERRHAARRRLAPRPRGRDGAGAPVALSYSTGGHRGCAAGSASATACRASASLRQRLARGLRVRGQRAAGARLDPRVLVEAPTYDRSILILQRAGADVVGIPVDGDGIDTGALAAELEREAPAFLYVIPNFQNPSGATMTLERRRRVLELAAQHDSWSSRTIPTASCAGRASRIRRSASSMGAGA